MRMMLLLLLSWMLSQQHAAAQTRAAGPWQVIRQPVRYRLHQDIWGDEDWGALPSPLGGGDTVTAVRMQRKLHRVLWNIHPDSITLFLGCQNPFRVPTAPRGKPALVRFEATGATVRLDSKQQLLLLIPSASVVVLRAYRGQRLIFKHVFKAVLPPSPTIKCYPGSCVEANDAPSGKERIMRTVTLRALPDRDFSEILPADALYRVARFRARLLRRGKAVEVSPEQPAEKMVQGPQGDMRDLAAVSQLGDQLQLDVLLVQRQSSLGIITEVPVVKQFIINEIKCPKQE